MRQGNSEEFIMQNFSAYAMIKKISQKGFFVMIWKHFVDRIEGIQENQVLAQVTFPAVDDFTVDINHTFVHDSLRGQGIAGQLMEEAAREIQSQKKTAVLSCSYAVTWFQKHPEYQNLLKK